MKVKNKLSSTRQKRNKPLKGRQEGQYSVEALENYPEKGTREYEEYLKKLKILEQIRLKKLKALELLSKYED